MLIKNACIENNEELKCIRIEDGKFKEIKKDLEPYAQEEVMDLEGKLVLPPFVESHVHLDICDITNRKTTCIKSVIICCPNISS